ncbi:uncharacterized protein PHALS_01061 [Plasmopara halstedii]|uniref:Uncharacterized protein n=1 Tax=Plasmopara halstedii TaxID=4781 RepID=A0A0P1AVU0_PLAHL|nr:uncharacterized protein PHALS_01061 [Plasmopara halstedii]CEG44719.1 hypothetical protein PHALS_01061 [Plasmopara halstedii]|eukprot:XP_024581088.1 hypothetical protein PHALS_01061 [Plasmopara halstedii]
MRESKVLRDYIVIEYSFDRRVNEPVYRKTIIDRLQVIDMDFQSQSLALYGYGQFYHRVGLCVLAMKT